MRRATLVVVAFYCLLLTVARAQVGSPLALDANNQVYFAGNGTVWKISPDGSVRPFVTGKQARTLVIDGQGNLCGDHQAWDNARKQQMYSFWLARPDGSVSELLPPTPDVPRGYSCLKDADGNMVAWAGSGDHRQIESYLLKRTPAGEVSVLAGGKWGHADGPAREAQFASIGAMAFGSGGAIFVTDDDSLRMILPNGLVTTVAKGGLLASFPQAHKLGSQNAMPSLALDERGNIYVAHFSNGTVMKVTPAGQVSTLLKVDWLWGPVAVAVSGDGVFVLETPNTPFTDGPRVQWIAHNGQVLTLATVPQPRSALGVFVAVVLVFLTFGVIVLLALARRAEKSPPRAMEQGRAA